MIDWDEMEMRDALYRFWRVQSDLAGYYSRALRRWRFAEHFGA